MDERKTLDSILKDDPISLEKCVNFALRCTIPANDRYRLCSVLHPSLLSTNASKDFDPSLLVKMLRKFTSPPNSILAMTKCRFILVLE